MLCPTKFMCWYSLFLLWFNHTSKSCQFKQDIWIGLTLLGELVSSSNFEKLCQLLLLSRVVQIQCNDWSTLLYIFCILPNTKMCKSMPPSLMTMILVSSSIKLGEGNGTPLQDSCLENPMDGGAWQATVRHQTSEHRHIWYLPKPYNQIMMLIIAEVFSTKESGSLKPRVENQSRYRA